MKIYSALPVLRTQRLFLRPVRESDVKDVFEFSSDAETARYTTWEAHRHIDQSRQLVKFIIKRYRSDKPSNWAVVLAGEEKLIGLCGFVSEFSANSRAEVSFVFNRAYWGKGYATEALKIALEFGFKEAGYNRIEAVCDSENAASARVLEKCGMKPEGTLRQYVFVRGAFRDMKSYAVLKGEFNQ